MTVGIFLLFPVTTPPPPFGGPPPLTQGRQRTVLTFTNCLTGNPPQGRLVQGTTFPLIRLGLWPSPPTGRFFTAFFLIRRGCEQFW